MWGVVPWSFDLARAVDGSGPAWGLALREAGRLTVVHWCAGWLACLVCGVEDTSSCFCFLAVCWGVGVGGCPCCVWGWHAVGVLG